MTDEERKAIKILKKTSEIHLQVDREPNEFDIAIQTLLNLINKYEKVIDRMAELIYKTWLNDSDAIVIHIDKVPENSSIKEIKEYFMEEVKNDSKRS